MLSTVDDLKSRAERVLASLPCDPFDGKSRIAIHGAGFLGRWAVPWLSRHGAHVVACFDGDPTKTGSRLDGVEILPPSAASSVAPNLVFITARHAVQPVSVSLASQAIAGLSLDAFCIARDLPGLLTIHDHVLDDERSRETLRAVIMTMLTGDSAYCASVFDRDQYFCLPRFCGSETETYVDAGAYVGDSLERFIWAQNGVFSRVYAFEPGPRQFASLTTRAKRLVAEWALDPASIELVHAGLSDRTGHIAMGSGSGQLQSLAIVEDATGAIPTLRLDDMLKGDRVSFIKADVEGMEMALIAGAEETITRFKPKIAICVYHYPTDILEITRRLQALVPDYRFSLRHHAPRFLETVLYCWTD